MSTEISIIKSSNGHIISIEDKTMEELGLKVGDRLNIEKRYDEIVMTKIVEKSFKEEWDEFFKNGHSYDNYETVDWGEDRGRERC